MCNSEEEYLKELQAHASNARTFLSNKMKSERERTVCRAFLRTIGVSFKESELIAPAEEPADVDFQNARFQVRVLLEHDRKQGDDWKQKEKDYAQADSLDELCKPYIPPTQISLTTLIPDVTEALVKKSEKYGAGCHGLDVLVYVDLKNRFLEPDSKIPNLDELKKQGWRSASLLFPPYGIILYAKTMAPEFLKKEGQHIEWVDTNLLFEA